MIFLKTLYNQSLDWWIKHKSMCYSSVWLTHARLPHHIFFIFFIFTYCRLANPLSVSVVKITISGTSFLGNVLKVFFFFFSGDSASAISGLCPQWQRLLMARYLEISTKVRSRENLGVMRSIQKRMAHAKTCWKLNDEPLNWTKKSDNRGHAFQDSKSDQEEQSFPTTLSFTAGQLVNCSNSSNLKLCVAL